MQSYGDLLFSTIKARTLVIGFRAPHRIQEGLLFRSLMTSAKTLHQIRGAPGSPATDWVFNCAPVGLHVSPEEETVPIRAQGWWPDLQLGRDAAPMRPQCLCSACHPGLSLRILHDSRAQSCSAAPGMPQPALQLRGSNGGNANQLCV
ncbi:uncharacterized protein LOC128929898 [Callithrix jacchus]